MTPTERDQRTAAAKKEHAAMKAWKQNGSKGDPPPTPALDEINREFAAGITAKDRRKAKKGTSTRVAQTVQFYKNGRAMNASDNVLSSLAYQCTKGLDGDKPRISTDALKSLLIHELGRDDLTTSSWDVTLPNGVVISARVPGATPPPQIEAMLKAQASTKAPKPAAATKPAEPAAKAPSKRTAPAKPAAKKAPATKQVTPIPKATKRPARKSAA